MKISCVKRDDTGTQASNKLRREHFIPGVVYGKGKKPESISMSRKDLDTIFKQLGTNAILDLEMNGKAYHVMLKDMQRHPIMGNVIHVDFLQVGKHQKVVVAVAVHLENDERLQTFGALVHLMDHVEVECHSDSIPKSFILDVGDLAVGDTKLVSDLTTEKGVVILNDPNEAVVTLMPFRHEVEPVVVGAAEVVPEPELIEKETKDE
jgi:large subunit ribosomal protein L25